MVFTKFGYPMRLELLLCRLFGRRDFERKIRPHNADKQKPDKTYANDALYVSVHILIVTQP